jgi:protein SCO1/2
MREPSRRRWLRGMATAIVGGAASGTAGLGAIVGPRPARAHDSVGPIRPAGSPPSVRLVTHDGARASLPDLLRAPVTAVQTMFTGCSAVCPIQGALFAQVQDALDALDPGAPAAAMRLLSISIDPLSDDPAALRRWLATFGAGARWSAAAPEPAELDRLLAFLKGRAAGGEPHGTQVAMFDVHGHFVWRTGELPAPAAMIRLADEIARG